MDLNSLPNDLEQLKAIVSSQAGTIEQQDHSIKSLNSKIELLIEEVRFFKALKYASSSERLKLKQQYVGQGTLFNEAEMEADNQSEDVAQEEQITVRPYTRKRGKRTKLPENLPREEVVIDLPEEDKVCQHDGSKLSCIGEEVSEKLKIIPAKISVVRTIRKKYACQQCSDCIKTPPPPPSLLPKSIATPSLLAFIITSKYVDGVPLHRMEAVLKRHNIELGRGTMSRWMIEVAERLAPLKQILLEELLSSSYLHCDETTVQVLKEKDKTPQSKSYMWVYGRSGRDPIILYDYHPSRSATVPLAILKGYQGYLQVDGYSGYNLIAKQDGVVRLGCMSHCRRYFYRAWSHAKDKNIGSRGLAFIKKLYKIEEKIKDFDPSARKKVRQEEALPILMSMKEWLDKEQGRHPPKGLAGKAISYALNEWDYLIRYLEDGNLDIDNNFIEQSIRPFAVGRKNWLFSNTPSGANASAFWYGLIETAKANGVEPFGYLQKLLEDFPNADELNSYLKLLPFKII